MTYFIIDSNNNNKVLREFDTKKECKDYIENMELTENWENSYDEFEDFKNSFTIISSKEMKEAVRTHGKGKLEYYN